jgi:DNA polymerase
VRQWLETDAAFGVSDVPLPRARRGVVAARPAAAVASPGEVRQQVQRAVETMRQAPVAASAHAAPVAPRAPVAPVPARPAVRTPVPAQETMARKKTFELPPEAVTPAGDIADLPALSRDEKVARLAKLQLEVEAACAPFLCEMCTRVVFGEGDADAPLMFVGEGPGTEEDRTGRPFVGRSGQLLDKMIVAMGFKREQVYIANVVKLRCAEPDEVTGRLKDRPPTPEEAARGLPVLHRQIEIIRPKVIVTLGAPAVKHLTGTTEGVTKIRGTWLNYRGIPVMPTYHPSFLLRAYTEENRRKVWGDLQMAMGKIKPKK